MKTILGAAAVALITGLGLSACGEPVTNDTEGMTLGQARASLNSDGVATTRITIRTTDGSQPTNDMIVCDHDPDGVAVTEPTTLLVAVQCSGNEDAGGDPDDAYDDGGSSSSKKKYSFKKSKRR